MTKEEIIKQIKEKACVSEETFKERLRRCYRTIRTQEREDMWVYPPYQIRDMLRDLLNIYLCVWRSDTSSYNDYAIHVAIYTNDSDNYILYDEILCLNLEGADIERDFHDVEVWIKENLCYSAEEFGKKQNK